MHNRIFCLLISAFTLLAYSADRPNLVVIMVDDLGYSDLGCYGGEIDTPNLDGLAAKGLRYSQMYNTSKCTTSRSALLTGRYVSRNSWAKNYRVGPTFGEVAKEAGYRTLWSGKNHSSIRPPERGFDRFYGFQGGCCNFWNPGPTMADGSAFPHISAYEWMVDDQWRKTYIPEDPDYFMTDAITDQALGWLREYEDEEKPFLLYLAYNAPHWPLHAPDDDIAKYKGRYDEGYQALHKERYDRMVRNELIDPQRAPMHPQAIKAWDSLSAEEQELEAQRMEIHAAMVDNLDQNIGRLLETLKQQGELENTLILFFADNGASDERDTRSFKQYTPTGAEKMGGVFSYECIGHEWAQVVNCPLSKFKKTSHEGGVCTPMIAHWPKGITGENIWCHEPTHLVDIMGTVLELAQQSYPKNYAGQPAKPLEGVSLVPSFAQQPLAQRTTPIGYDFAMGQGLRDGKWKLVKFTKNPWELYDMSMDRTETRNLANRFPEKVDAMAKQYAAWHQQCAEGLPSLKKK